MKYKRARGKTMVKRSKNNLNFNGVLYKSSLEKKMAILLTEAKIPFEYEPKTIPLIEGFYFPFDCWERQTNGKGEFKNRGGKKIIGMGYTPDFVGENFLIETKGYANESFPLRWKLFKKSLLETELGNGEYTLFKPQTIKECEIVIQIIKSKLK